MYFDEAVWFLSNSPFLMYTLNVIMCFFLYVKVECGFRFSHFSFAFFFFTFSLPFDF